MRLFASAVQCGRQGWCYFRSIFTRSCSKWRKTSRRSPEPRFQQNFLNLARVPVTGVRCDRGLCEANLKTKGSKQPGGIWKIELWQGFTVTLRVWCIWLLCVITTRVSTTMKACPSDTPQKAPAAKALATTEKYSGA